MFSYLPPTSDGNPNFDRHVYLDRYTDGNIHPYRYSYGDPHPNAYRETAPPLKETIAVHLSQSSGTGTPILFRSALTNSSSPLSFRLRARTRKKLNEKLSRSEAYFIGAPQLSIAVQCPLPVGAPHDLLDKFLSDREIKSGRYLGDNLLLGDKAISEIGRKSRDPIIGGNRVVTSSGVAGDLGYEGAQTGE